MLLLCILPSTVYSKDWCLPQNKYQRNIPFHKLEDGENCPSKTTIITKEKALEIFFTEYNEYLNNIINSGGICVDTFKNYKYLRELIKNKKDFKCVNIKNKGPEDPLDDNKSLDETSSKKVVVNHVNNTETSVIKKHSKAEIEKMKKQVPLIIEGLKEYVKLENKLDWRG